jgi:hypothetical protein
MQEVDATDWTGALKADPTEWLLSEGQPWVVYRTLVDILDRDEADPNVGAAKESILQAEPVMRILAEQREDGGWEGDYLCYSCSSQHQGDTMSLLSVFADFGLKVGDDGVARACEFALRFQTDSGDFHVTTDDQKTFVCLSADTVRSLAALGLAADERVERSYQYLVDTQRLDGGWIHSKSAQRGQRREHIPSCPFATLNALWALAEHPELRDSQVARDAAEVVLRHREERSRPYGWGIGSQWPRLKYPHSWYGLLKYADVLSRFSFLNGDPRFEKVIDLLLAKQDEEGRWQAESIYKYWKDFDFGQKRSPSPWITLLALRVVRRVRGGELGGIVASQVTSVLR